MSSSHTKRKSKTTSFEIFWVISINTPYQVNFYINPDLYHPINFLRRYLKPSLGSILVKTSYLLYCCNLLQLRSKFIYLLAKSNSFWGKTLAPRSKRRWKNIFQNKFLRTILINRHINFSISNDKSKRFTKKVFHINDWKQLSATLSQGNDISLYSLQGSFSL